MKKLMDISEKSKWIAIWLCMILVVVCALSKLNPAVGIKVIAVVLCLSIVSFFTYFRTNQSVKVLFGATGVNDEKRIWMYDYLRIMAMLFVIITHSIQADLSQNLVEGAGETYIMTAIYWFCLVCNPIYVMLSGALLLPYKDEKFSRFYLRRFSRVVIPMFVYYFFYVWGDYRATMKMGDVVKTTVKNFVQGSTPESPHYWLIYTILCIYILVPFLRDMCKNISYKALTILVILSCIFMCNGTLFTVTFAISYYFNPWLCVAIMGYWLSRPETRKYDKALMVLGACGLVIGLWMIYIGEDFAAKCCNTSPVMLFIAMGLFAMVCKAKIFSRGNWIVKMISKYSFPMILVHWAGLYLVVRGKLNIYAVNYHGLGIIISLLANVVVDFVLAFLIDNMIVRAFSTAFDLMINVLRKGVDSASKALTGK